MKNIIKIFRNMMEPEGIDIRYIDVDMSVIDKIAKRIGVEIEAYCKNEITFYKARTIDNNAIILLDSFDDEKKVQFACISDIHIGAQNINIEKLRKFLEKCTKENIYWLFIAGDLFEGINLDVYLEGSSDLKTPEFYATILFDILKDYNFHFIIINGNHDYSFEVIGQINPNQILSNMLKNFGRKVTYIDSFNANIVIGGIGIRVVHLDNSYASVDDICPCINYAQKHLEKVDYIQDNKTGKKYQIHVMICGHVHRHELNQYREVLIFQPGSIKDDSENSKLRIGFIAKITVEGEIIKEFYIV